MKVIKSLLLGSTAVFAGVAVAQAADLPSRKAAPADYVKICDAYGAGYFYIPGTDTCLKVGGYVRAEYGWSQPSNALAIPSWKNTGAAGVGAAIANTSFVPSGVEDQTGFVGRGRLEMDARTQTAFGTARSFVGLRAQSVTGIFNSNYQTVSTLTGQTGTTAITVENAIVQFAGFTFGHTTAELFAFMPAPNYGSYSTAGYPGGINLLSYTATFGGGFSGSIGIEDRAGLSYSVNPGFVNTNMAGGVSGVAGSATNAAGGVVANGPMTWPALAANLRFDQPWGAFQVMGQVVQNSAVVTLGSAANPNFALTATGWAVGAGVKINLPMMAAGDTLYMNAAYGNGDLDEVLNNNTSASPANIGRELGGLYRQDRNMYVTPSNASTAATCTAALATSACFSSQQSTAWSLAAYATHYWTSTIRSVLLGSYAQITPPNTVQNTDWTIGGLSKATIWKVGAQLVWSPVKDLDIGAEVQYMSLSQRFTTAPGAAATAQLGGLIPAVGASANAWEGRVRVQRQF